ncbi:hypothetical protein ASPACDRAFT_62042 [Aspergillus aculeatus ATCC 16872]|uniref:CCHC-type domain-containing protein n=1 Tax=Aspergillus aculeatus (strain ATCC 16872 / CBS 172.66 / WB 5094) TaxID=690307 RepID=A0A1L9WQT7_ASPA1|nr:uncharacterized protein ASPACDRAFT_62042 [Aspergillus aculeatus ATCC 16872]OJJ98542.1 hypothetical protein ASPACDRAFT_62042 [Aspergillus aculeatus ATCC 16872]
MDFLSTLILIPKSILVSSFGRCEAVHEQKGREKLCLISKVSGDDDDRLQPVISMALVLRASTRTPLGSALCKLSAAARRMGAFLPHISESKKRRQNAFTRKRGPNVSIVDTKLRRGPWQHNLKRVMKKVRCYYCNEMGHIKANCHSYHRDLFALDRGRSIAQELRARNRRWREQQQQQQQQDIAAPCRGYERYVA